MTFTARTGPLEDITIIDCSMAFAGPFGTALLADQITWWAPQRARDPWIAAPVRSMTGGGRPVLQMTKTAAAEAATALQKWLRAQP